MDVAAPRTGSTGSTRRPTTRRPNPRGEGGRLGTELVEAATRLLEEGGRDTELTLRGVARTAGVAAPSVYAHFADLDALMLALVRHHLAHLTRHVTSAVAEAGPHPDGPEGARSQLRTMARAYVEWGLAHPGPYTVVFEGRVLRHLTRDQELALLAGDDLMDGLVRLVAAARAETTPGGPSEQAALVATSLWSSLHGVVALRTAKPAYPWPDLDAQVALMLEAWSGSLTPAG